MFGELKNSKRRREPEQTVPLDDEDYPERMDWQTCRQYVERTHERGWDREEFIGGPIFREGEPFVLSELETNNIRIPGGYEADQRIIEHYAQLGAPFPPIVVSANGHVIDGFHRLSAVLQTDCSTLRAYVPEAIDIEDLEICQD